LKLNGAFADIMEISFYNTVLGSMSHDGKRFTYVNQLASSHEDPCKREEWFTCACCPPNVLRLLGMIGGYIWTHRIDPTCKTVDIEVHLYISSTLTFEVEGESVQLTQESNWPWDGEIKFHLKTTLRNVRIRLRIPGWAENFGVRSSDQ
jgi:uncharacterized protein